MAKQSNLKVKNDRNEVTLVGIVYEYGNDQEALGIMIVTEEDEEFLIVLDHEGEKLWDYVDEEVIVTGTISKDDNGDLYISVRNFDSFVFDDDEDDWDDDDY
jgi:hypothetical protein